MFARAVVIGVVAGACGEVAALTPDAVVDAPSKSYKGMLDATMPSRFGGAPFCTYTETLKQLAIELRVPPGGHVVSGHVQNLNVEAVVVSTNPVCPADFPVIAPSIAMYTFQSARPTQNGMTLIFRGAPTNNPSVDLTVDTMSVGSAFQAQLGFHRNDLPPPLDWSVIATVSLSPQ